MYSVVSFHSLISVLHPTSTIIWTLLFVVAYFISLYFILRRALKIILLSKTRVQRKKFPHNPSGFTGGIHTTQWFQVAPRAFWEHLRQVLQGEINAALSQFFKVSSSEFSVRISPVILWVVPHIIGKPNYKFFSHYKHFEFLLLWKSFFICCLIRVFVFHL